MLSKMTKHKEDSKCSFLAFVTLTKKKKGGTDSKNSSKKKKLKVIVSNTVYLNYKKKKNFFINVFHELKDKSYFDQAYPLLSLKLMLKTRLAPVVSLTTINQLHLVNYQQMNRAYSLHHHELKMIFPFPVLLAESVCYMSSLKRWSDFWGYLKSF